MTCDNCGATLAPGAIACPTCGASTTSTSQGGPTPGPTPGQGGGYGEPVSGQGDGDGVPTPGQGGGYPAPGAHPSGLSSEVRNWAMAAHLSAFLGAFVALAVLGPLVVWLIRREVDGFSEEHAREALNFNLTLLLALVVGIVVSILTLGIGLVVVVPVGLIVGLVWIVLTIIATVRASEGSSYRYPLTIRFVS